MSTSPGHFSYEGLDIQRRQPVWEAISDLWRDTELQDFEVRHIATVLAKSGYSPEELEDIFAFEVAPVVWQNFMAAAPAVWSGFDAEWLQSEVVKNIERQRAEALYRWYVRSKLWRWLRTRLVEDEWSKVLKLFEEQKDGR